WPVLPLQFQIRKRSMNAMEYFCMTINDLRVSSPSVTMSSMKTNRQGGYVSGALLSLIVTSVLLVGTLSFGVWAFMSRSDYKNHSDQKASVAADESKKKTEATDAIKYAEEAKSPLKSHVGPSQYGSITTWYPKTWSAYINESTR